MIPLPSKSHIVQKEGNKAVLEVAGLYPGYGVTIGNCLRRVLLSSLKGAAITQIKIEAVSHEFSAIPGVFEDVIFLILNLKRLTFKMYSDEPQTITLSVKGEREVKGKDFKLTSELELANPEAHIATITKSSSELKIEALVESGIGYWPAKDREVKKVEIGVIPIDAIFAPVRKVSFKVENMRVGKRTDFDLLRLEIETDGTIEPEKALKESIGILMDHFSVIAKVGEELTVKVEDILIKKSAKVAQGSVKNDQDNVEIEKVKIEESKLSERIKNALLANNIKTIGGLVKKSETTLLQMEGLGDKAISEIKKTLKKAGLELKAS
ncbi:DNA-directed RNA polymerase subunit alpha [bacterium (Candidatus Gribaldobacteria) CG08_land_8_20_14_0_20_39_15]|uniref:DNA-directed RNA polymerase subunit alpha n=1 Tax=bacterium (Candidatus Gribaldobacteria) CG08_land_8_20_14_0_20_39_15 TaxID=2014273 RepID=A0A2M6XV11_9BACT|nr:MAG: DNA-directed RNA polymerase subunit alpha [bacterium (Candidatus Gribaldobacteria) CG08_land_8_20_14_0_20_39_15]